jgi:hypothetical protein
MVNPQYRFYLWQSCVYTANESIIDAVPIDGFLVVTVADVTGFTVGGIVTYEQEINGITTTEEAIITAIDTGTNAITLNIAYIGGAPIMFVSISQWTRTAVTVYDFFIGKYAWERNEQQYMRKLFEGKLMFKNDAKNGVYDYDLLESAFGVDCCCSFVLDIERYCGGAWELDYQGVFTSTDCTVNAEQCWIRFEIRPYDTYRCLLESGTPEVNILKIANIESVDIDYSNQFEFVDCADSDPGGVVIPWIAGFPNFGGCQVPDPDAVVAMGGSFVQTGCITFGEGWIPFETTVFAVYIGGNLVRVTQRYFREFRLTLDVGGVPNPPDGNGWINVGSVAPTLQGTRTKWVRRPYDGYYDTYTAIFATSPCTNTVVAKIEIPGDIVTYDRCRTFADVLDYVAKQTCGQVVGIRSDFFDINPVGDSPDYVPGENYVTEATNQLNDLLVLQKSDFINPTSTNEATKGLITWQDLIDEVCIIFNCGWYIDFDGYVRIEHAKYFEAYQLQNQINLTLEPANANQELFEYDKTNLPQSEVWSWMDEVGDDFEGNPIKYDPNCTDEGTPEKGYSIQHFTTDVDYMQAAPTEISPDGFVLIARDGSSAIQSTSPVSGLVLNNGPLAQVTLQPAYYTWRRILDNGIMNGVQTSFDSAIHRRKTKDLILKDCCKSYTFENSYALTSSGNCLIDGVEFDAFRNIYTLKLKTDGNC